MKVSCVGNCGHTRELMDVTVTGFSYMCSGCAYKWYKELAMAELRAHYATLEVNPWRDVGLE